MKRKTHAMETKKDTGPAIPRTVCGREAYAVQVAAQDELPTCKSCKSL